MESGDADIHTYQPVGNVQVSPNSGRRTFIPDVDDLIKPQMHMTFDSLENAFRFYQRYAKAGGFTARKGTQYEPRKGVIHNKWFVCSKEGTKPLKAIDSTQEAGSSNVNSKSKITRRVPSIRTGCEACIRVKLIAPDNLYVVYYFEESHNHSFVAEDDRYLLPENRYMNYVQEEAVNALSAINVGPVRAFNIMRTLYGGFDKAANIYTRTIFFDAQLEIQTAIHKCAVGKWDDREDNFVNFSVKDFSQACTTFFQVMMRQLDMTVSCSCNRYEQFGLLCAHIFCVLRLLDIRQFPERYIMRRWTREAVPNSAPGAILGISESDDRYQQVNGVVREITRSAESLINRLVHNFDALCAFRDHVVQYQSTADQAVVNAPPRSRRDRFAEITGYTQETPVTVRMPKTIRFKGMGKPSRMKSSREIAIIQSAKKKKGRECGNCKRRGHNRRTCSYPTRENADDSSESDEADLEGEDEEELEDVAGEGDDEEELEDEEQE
ncbi:uncharacterized protein LOC110867120 [Helianthus annuus]|uniref:uncharacterized protein LOC110867120 n=1 Tax=Helianthus annuus TaxID=4232 RepID=UPI001652D439|nr:uncharacterized protein LOC110867120 [Helianthus annuus]